MEIQRLRSQRQALQAEIPRLEAQGQLMAQRLQARGPVVGRLVGRARGRWWVRRWCQWWIYVQTRDLVVARPVGEGADGGQAFR